MAVVTDNLDLAARRKRLGLSQQDIADLFCGFDAGSGKGFDFSNVSRFETGAIDLMPAPTRGAARLARPDYEDLLDRLETDADRAAS